MSHGHLVTILFCELPSKHVYCIIDKRHIRNFLNFSCSFPNLCCDIRIFFKILLDRVPTFCHVRWLHDSHMIIYRRLLSYVCARTFWKLNHRSCALYKISDRCFWILISNPDNCCAILQNIPNSFFGNIFLIKEEIMECMLVKHLYRFLARVREESLVVIHDEKLFFGCLGPIHDQTSFA